MIKKEVFGESGKRAKSLTLVKGNPSFREKGTQLTADIPPQHHLILEDRGAVPRNTQQAKDLKTS